MDMLTTEEFNGADILVDTSEPVDELVVRSIMMDKLQDCLSLLSQEERELIHDSFYTALTERDIAAKLRISQAAVNKRKKRIVEKIKKHLESQVIKPLTFRHWGKGAEHSSCRS